MKIFWSWQSDTPGKIGRFLVRDALNDAIERLRAENNVEDAPRDLYLDHDVKDVPGSPDLVRTILTKIEKCEVVIADVTIVGKTAEGKSLINSNVAIELGYAFHARTDERTVLVFNKHYGKHEELPFDLRHKGGGVDFDLKPNASKGEIDEQRRLLNDAFVRKLKPFVEGRARIKEVLSLRPLIEPRILQRHPMPEGGTDDVFELNVFVENDGETPVKEFLLVLEMPSSFPDGSTPYGMDIESAPPGFVGWSRTGTSSGVRVETVYPGRKTESLIRFNGAVKAQTKRYPEELEKTITATAYAGNMQKKYSLAIKNLYSELPLNPQ
ncbi:MAG TPA: hypothetical protein VFB79_07125 [Candidatus Angelobacter sp.]|nr:hypothetical protein [Candidatus Angelobacter sp.]